MNDFKGQAISWRIVNGAIELALHRKLATRLDRGRSKS